MINGGWVCALHVRTAGLGGAALGSDEEEIVYLAYVVIDVPTNQIGGRAHNPPGVKWLLEPIDIYNVNAPPILRYKSSDLSIVTTAASPFKLSDIMKAYFYPLITRKMVTTKTVEYLKRQK